MLLNISNVQHFSLGDGPGIRTTIFFKGCPLRCPWCHNPETISPQPAQLFYKATGKREVRGMSVECEALLPELLADRDYFAESGGGVTLSGGEVMLQSEGAAQLASLLCREGISVYVDTAGYVPYANFERMNPYTDTYLYDFKTASETLMRTVIGGDLSRITDNLRRLLADGKSVRIRIPLIPGFNTDDESVDGICRALGGMGIGAVDLLPFHRLGSGKYEAMGLTYAYAATQPLRGEPLDALRRRFERDFTVRVEQ
jgi:pyruvate formate lyase activating enzyme